MKAFLDTFEVVERANWWPEVYKAWQYFWIAVRCRHASSGKPASIESSGL